jgi:hypothetical protein
VGGLLLALHDSVEDLEDGVQAELVEGTLNTLVGGLGPFLGLGVEERVTLEWLLAFRSSVVRY